MAFTPRSLDQTVANCHGRSTCHPSSRQAAPHPPTPIRRCPIVERPGTAEPSGCPAGPTPAGARYPSPPTVPSVE